MLRTFLVCAVFIVLGVVAADWLTRDFQVWTAEGARRLDVAIRPVPAPAVAVGGPDVRARTLPELLANGQAVTIVDFIYTRCQTVCQLLGSEFQRLQASIQARDELRGRVRLLSISFDPDHDTAGVLRDYATRMRAAPDTWMFARVPDERQLDFLLEEFKVLVLPDARGGFVHNAALLVVDRHGRLVRVFDYTERDTALAYAGSLAGGPDT